MNVPSINHNQEASQWSNKKKILGTLLHPLDADEEKQQRWSLRMMKKLTKFKETIVYDHHLRGNFEFQKKGLAPPKCWAASSTDYAKLSKRDRSIKDGPTFDRHYETP